MRPRRPTRAAGWPPPSPPPPPPLVWDPNPSGSWPDARWSHAPTAGALDSPDAITWTRRHTWQALVTEDVVVAPDGRVVHRWTAAWAEERAVFGAITPAGGSPARYACGNARAGAGDTPARLPGNRPAAPRRGRSGRAAALRDVTAGLAATALGGGVGAAAGHLAAGDPAAAIGALLGMVAATCWLARPRPRGRTGRRP